MEKWLKYTDFLLAIGIILLWGFLVILFLSMWIGSKYTKNKFFKAARKSLEFEKIEDILSEIRNDFEVYRRYRFGFKNNTIIELCQELEQKIKLEGNLEIVSKLNKVINSFKDEYKFDDEKMNEVIDNVGKKSGKDDARKIREYLIRLNAYTDGILYEKDRHLIDIQDKLTRRKWFSLICGIVGFVGSIASIYSIFK